MTTADTITGLLAAIDAGDDALLPILADALEDVADARAAGLRLISDRRPHVGLSTGDGGVLWSRGCVYARVFAPRSQLPDAVYDRLKGGRIRRRIDWPTRLYPTRTAAYFTLAAALTEGAP